MRDFMDLADFSGEQVQDLISLAKRLETRPEPDALRGKVLGLLFFNPSLRTLASFQAGMARLGGQSFVVTPQASWQLEHRAGVTMDGLAAEHVREAIPVLASYADALGIRAFAGGVDLEADIEEHQFRIFHELCEMPLINMESAVNHPCQSLADWKTLDDLGVRARNTKFVLSWAQHPKPLPLAVPAATVHMAALRGMDVTVLRPEGFELPGPVMDRARQAAERSGGSLAETSDRHEALDGAQVVYAKSWGSTRHYGDGHADAALRAGLTDWCVDEPWFGSAAEDCRFMHCLPVRRGVVVSDRVLDSPRSVVRQQARNRMFAQMAVLYRLLKRTGS